MLNVEFIPMEQFALKWRFMDARCRVLPPRHLAQLHPLAPESARRIWDLTLPLHCDLPFTAGLFRSVESTPLHGVDPEAVRAVRKWLFRRRLPFKARVFLSYQPDEAIATTWKMVANPCLGWREAVRDVSPYFLGLPTPRTSKSVVTTASQVFLENR